MTTFKVFASILALLITMTVAQAQPGGFGQQRSPEERAEVFTKRLDKEIGLTQDQKIEIYEISLSANLSRDSMIAKVMNQEISREEARAQGEVLRKEQDAKIEALLTEEQLPKYEVYKEKMRQRMDERRQGQGDRRRGRGGRGGRP